MKEIIEVIDLDSYEEGYGGSIDSKEVWIEFLDWHIVIAVKDGDDSKAKEEILIIAKNGGESTADFFMFKNGNTKQCIKPNGMNLYQVMDLLITNYKKRKENKKDE